MDDCKPLAVGRHFQLADCRVWMRLHFWAAREAGAYTCPFFQLNVSNFCETRWLMSLCQ